MNVLITGASTGIGRQLASDYAVAGHRVWGSSRSGQAPDHVEALSFDVTSIEQIESACQSLDSIDLLILNAGGCEYIDDPVNFDAALFKRVIDTNLIGAANCLQVLLPKVACGGRVVFVSSSASFMPLPRAEAYGASKAGLQYLADTLRVDLAAHSIHVSVVNPGFVETPLTDKNTFDMPFRIPVERASREIIAGIDKGRMHIKTPWGFTTALQWLGALPRFLQHQLALRVRSNT
ncbi:MAG: SDR family NAD(P)-dependent oxidoreductase [Gammaproteobacteria bacterium]|nr:SDR family NAD(P)-dependent oxidoreductase [Gammaproteobacteria bacterium]